MSEKTQFAIAAIYSIMGLLGPTETHKVLAELNSRFGHLGPSPELPKVYNVNDLAKRWRLHVNTVRLMLANDPKIGAYQEGCKWLVRQDDLDDYERVRKRR